MKRHNKNLVLFFVLTICLTLSCKKNDPPGPTVQNPATLKADNPNPFPFEAELLKGTNINLTKGTYSGTIGGKNITLVGSGSNLSFQVPAVAPGNYDMKANIEGTDYTISFTIKDLPTVLNAQAYLNAYAKQTLAITFQVHIVLQQIQPYADTVAMGNDLKVINKDLTDAISVFNLLSPADQLKAAQVIAANRSWLDELHNSVLDVVSNFSLLKIKKRSDIESDQVSSLNKFNTDLVGIRLDIIKSLVFAAGGGLGTNPEPANVGGFISLVDVMQDVSAMNVSTSKAVDIAMIVTASTIQKKATSFSFVSGKKSTHAITGDFRSMTKDDIGTNEALTKGFVPIVDEVNGWTKKIKSYIGATQGIGAETTPIANITSPITTSTRTLNSTYLSVQNISNSSVTLQNISDSATSVSFIFMTTESSDQNFTFDLVYENPGITKIVTNCSGTIAVSSSPTVKDIDGNLYHTITIGNQVWMLENLRTTKYRDGTPIPYLTDLTTWAGINNTDAYCDVNNNASNAATYGRLYNWHAVNSGHNICPPGWHVPTDSEWTVLTNFLGGEFSNGGKLKETGTLHWQSPNTGATNETGFTALPAGLQDGTTKNNKFLQAGMFWTNTENTIFKGFAWSRQLYFQNNDVQRQFNDENYYGFSVRLVKD